MISKVKNNFHLIAWILAILYVIIFILILTEVMLKPPISISSMVVWWLLFLVNQTLIVMAIIFKETKMKIIFIGASLILLVPLFVLMFANM